MNSTQKQEILDLIEKLEKFDLIGFIRSQGIESLESYIYNERNFSDFSFQLQRMLEQLRSELNNSDYRFLPISLNSNTEFGNIVLNQDLNELLTSIKTHGNEVNTTRVLDRLIFYQINFGFWDRSSVNIHDSRTIDIKRRLNDLRVLEEQFNSFHKIISSDIEVINDLKQELRYGLGEIHVNSSNILNVRNEIENHLNVVKNNLDYSNEIRGKIIELESKITEAFNKINTDINEYAKKFTDISNGNSTLANTLTATIKDSIKQNEKIIENYTYINSQKNEIEKMVGLATDGAIGYKFDERQKNIFKSTKFWRWIVPVSYIIAAVWVITVFSLLRTDVGNVWLNLLINLVKTTPAWFLVGFCTNQYKKEREFEEEYAFKSAVAMTITSYTSLLSNDEIDKMKTKDQVLSKVLDNLYSSPLKKEIEKKESMTRKGISTDVSSKSKELEEILKPVIELMKEIKK